MVQNTSIERDTWSTRPQSYEHLHRHCLVSDDVAGFVIVVAAVCAGTVVVAAVDATVVFVTITTTTILLSTLLYRCQRQHFY